MIRVATYEEMYSDVFANLIHRNSQLEFSRNLELCWQIPWSYYMANIRVHNRVLCTGVEKKHFQKVIKNETDGLDVDILTEDDDIFSNSFFNCIINCGRIEDILKYIPYLAEGSKIVATDKFEYNDGFADLCKIRSILKNHGLSFYRQPTGLNALSYTYDLKMITGQPIVSNSECFFGIVLFKHFSVETIHNAVFSVNRNRIEPNYANAIIDYLDINQDAYFKRIKGNNHFRLFYLPSVLIEKEYFTSSDLKSIYNTDDSCVLELVNELICGEYILPI